MNYEEMSDFEINKLVADTESLIIEDEQYLGGESKGVLVNCITEQFMFDPCNNPSDAWPIIVENKIDIRHEKGKELCKASEDIALYHNGHRYMKSATHKNPLRAAMICYLMMNEDK